MEKHEAFAVLPHKTNAGFPAFIITDSRGNKARDVRGNLRVFSTPQAAVAARDLLRTQEPEAYVNHDVWLALVHDEPGADPEAVELCTPFEGLLPEGHLFMYRFGLNEPTVDFDPAADTGSARGEIFKVEMLQRLYRRPV